MTYRKEIVSHRVPFGLYTLQNMGRQHRVFRGEGEFVGEDAYREFKRLATVFYDASPGTLTHPLWDTTTAYFAALGVRQEPTRDYVSYDFEFWEFYGGYGGGMNLPGVMPTSDIRRRSGSPAPNYYTVSYGENLWNVANRTGLAVHELLALNPQIKNLNDISVGKMLRIA